METAREIAVVARPTRSQVIRLVRWQVLTTPRLRNTLLLGLIGAPVLFLLYRATSGQNPPVRDFAMVWVAGLVFALAFLLLVPLFAVRSPAVREMLEYGIRYRFSADSVFMRGQKGTSDVQWAAFDAAVRRSDFYALRLSANRAWCLVPASAFGSPDEEREFAALVRGKLGAAAKL